MNGVWRWWVVTGVWCGVLSGCSGVGSFGEWPVFGTAAPAAVAEEGSDPVWKAFDRLAVLTAEEAQQRLPEALGDFRAQRTADARLWVLLLLLKAPPREFGDAWALEVLDAVGGGARPSGSRRDLEAFLRHLFAERLAREGALKRAEAGVEKGRNEVRALQSALAAERRRAEGSEREKSEAVTRLEPLETALTAERARVRDLEAQLEQLTDIEKILQRREETAGGKGSP